MSKPAFVEMAEKDMEFEAEYVIHDLCNYAEQKKARKKIESRYSDLTPHIEIIRREGTPTYNIQCRNYGEYRDRNGKVIERTCTVGMDMCYCSKNCAYATNNVCSLKG